MMVLVFALVLALTVPVVVGLSIHETIKNRRDWSDVQRYRLNDDGSVTPI